MTQGQRKMCIQIFEESVVLGTNDVLFIFQNNDIKGGKCGGIVFKDGNNPRGNSH